MLRRFSLLRLLWLPTALLALPFGCRGGDETQTRPPIVEITVDEPHSGAFVGGAEALVAGSINDPQAELWVAGERVNVDRHGRFETVVPVDGAWRIVDLVAANPRSETTERIPVFSGSDPMETWPGGTTMRLTAAGLADLGDLVGATLDATGWQAGLEDLIAGSQVEAAPVEMALVPTDGGVDIQLLFADLLWSFDVELPLFGATPVSVSFSELALSAAASARSAAACSSSAAWASSSVFQWQCLYFLPLPQWHNAFREVFIGPPSSSLPKWPHC